MFVESDAAPASSPTEEALRHLQALDTAVAGSGSTDVGALAAARPSWPVWPQGALSSLVGPPARVLAHLDQRWLHRFEASVAFVHALSASVGGPGGGPSGLSLLVERAAMLGHHGWGTWSAGTSCRLLEARDGWMAVNLPREDDLDAVPAWLEADDDVDAWALVEANIGFRSRSTLLERAALLGLAVAAVPGADARSRPCPAVQVAPGERTGLPRFPKVVDLSSLWAGPLCGWYLARAGAVVTKVEASRRPDGARRGTPGFYRRLNGMKQLVELDLSESSGRAQLERMVDEADIVIEASRPRALAALGIDAERQAANGTIWCSITGHGRHGASGERVAFGDDAAAGGGLVTYVEGEPWFVGDAAADPVSGVHAAAGVLGLWARGCAGMVEVAMVDSVRSLTGGVPVRSLS